MPRPFDPDLITGWKFITNYLMAGCSPANILVIDTNTEPEKDLAMLILVPDLQDIVQEIFDPSGGRKRKPNRHGKKPPGGRKTLDTSTLIARPIRAIANPHNALRLSPLRYAFPILNIYEGVMFTAAIVDGLGDIGFDNLWGVLNADPSKCVGISRLERYSKGPVTIGGFNPPIAGIRAANIISSTGYESFDFGCRGPGEYHVAIEGVVTPAGPYQIRGRMAIGTDPDNIVSFGSEVTVNPGEFVSAQASANFENPEYAYWGWHQESPGFLKVTDFRAISFSEADWPWPWDQ